MAISFSCNRCGAQFSVKDEFAGKKTRCKKCNTPLSIPALRDDSDPPDLGFLDDEPAPRYEPPASSQAGSYDDLAPRETPASAPMSFRQLAAAAQAPSRPAPAIAASAAASAGSAFAPLRRSASLSDPELERRSIMLSILFAALVIMIVIAAYTQTPRGTSWVMVPALVAFVLVGFFGALTPGIMAGVWCACKMFGNAVPPRLYFRSAGAMLTQNLIGMGVQLVAVLVIGLLVGLLGLPQGVVIPLMILVLLLQLYIYFAVFHRYFSLGIGGTIVASVLAYIFGGILSIPLVVAIVATMPAIDLSDTQIARSLERREQDRIAKQETERVATQRREAERTASATPPAVVPTAPAAARAMTPDEQAIFDRLSTDIEALSKTAFASREYMAGRVEKIRAELADLRKQTAHPSIGELEAKLPHLQALANNAPSELQGSEIYEVPPSSPEVDAPAIARPIRISCGPIDLDAPAGFHFTQAEVEGRPVVRAISARFGASAEITTRPLKDPKQVRMASMSLKLFVSEPAYDFIASVPGAVRRDVSIAGKPGIVVAAAPSQPSIATEERYAVRIGDEFVIISLTSQQPNDDLSPLRGIVASARVRESGIEPVIIGKPAFLVDWLVRTDAVPEPTDAMLGNDPKAVEDALLASLQDRDAKAKLPRFAYTLRKVATKESVPHLLKLAGRGSEDFALTRKLLTRLDPSNDAFTFALIDFRQSTPGSELTAVFDELGRLPFDPQRKAELNSALAIPMSEDAFFTLNYTPEAAKVLGTWGDEKVMQRLLAILANPRAQSAERSFAIQAASYRDDPKVAASISKWVLQEPDGVVAALSVMPKSGEIVAMNLLTEKDARARKAGAQVLASVGTRRCIAALTRASKDPRDPAAAAEAEATLIEVNARIAAATQPTK